MSPPELDTEKQNYSVVRQAGDTLAYVAAVTAVLVIITSLVTYPLDSNAVIIKQVLFVFGWLAFGYGFIRLWPRRVRLDEESNSSDKSEWLRTENDETVLQRYLRSVPVFAYFVIQPEARWPRGVRLVLLGVFALVVSFLMEVVFGVGV